MCLFFCFFLPVVKDHTLHISMVAELLRLWVGVPAAHCSMTVNNGAVGGWMTCATEKKKGVIQLSLTTALAARRDEWGCVIWSERAGQWGRGGDGNEMEWEKCEGKWNEIKWNQMIQAHNKWRRNDDELLMDPFFFCKVQLVCHGNSRCAIQILTLRFSARLFVSIYLWQPRNSPTGTVKHSRPT